MVVIDESTRKLLGNLFVLEDLVARREGTSKSVTEIEGGPTTSSGGDLEITHRDRGAATLTPVRFPPGCAKLFISPSLIGSLLTATIGIVEVAFFRGVIIHAVCANTTSKLRFTTCSTSEASFRRDLHLKNARLRLPFDVPEASEFFKEGAIVTKAAVFVGRAYVAGLRLRSDVGSCEDDAYRSR
jgi:hypothetical protein